MNVRTYIFMCYVLLHKDRKKKLWAVIFAFFPESLINFGLNIVDRLVEIKLSLLLTYYIFVALQE